MEKKKLKLSISGSSNKTINSIEQAKNQSKNTVVIEKKSKRFLGKSQTSRTSVHTFCYSAHSATSRCNDTAPLHRCLSSCEA